MLTFESLRDLIRDRGIAAQNGASDLGLFGATSQTFVLGSVDPANPTDGATPHSTMAGFGSTGADNPFDLSAFDPVGGFWASLLNSQFVFEPYTSIASLSVPAPQSAKNETDLVSGSSHPENGQAHPAPSAVSTSPLVMMSNMIGPVDAPGMPISPVDSISLPTSLATQTVLGATSDVIVQAQSALAPATIVIVATDLLGSMGDDIPQITAPLSEAISVAAPLLSVVEPASIISIASGTIVEPVASIVDEAAPVVSSLLGESAGVISDASELLVSDVPDVVQQIAAPVVEAISSVAEPVASVIEPVVQTLAPETISIVDAVGGAVAQVNSAATALAVDSIVETVDATVAEAAPIVSAVIEEAVIPATNAAELLPTVVPDVAQDIVAPVARTVPFLGESVAPIIETVSTGVQGSGSATTIITGSSETATEAIASIPSATTELTDRVTDDIIPAVASLSDAVDLAPDAGAETAYDLAASPAAVIETITGLSTQPAAATAAVDTIVETVVDQPEPTNVATLSDVLEEPVEPLGGADVPSGIAVLTDLLAADTQFAIQDQQTGQDVFAPAPAPVELVTEFADLGTASPAHEAPDPINHLLHDDSPLGGTLGHLFDNDGGLHG